MCWFGQVLSWEHESYTFGTLTTWKSRNVTFQQQIFEDGILRCAQRQNIVADHQPMPTHHSAIYSSGTHLHTIDQLKQAVLQVTTNILQAIRTFLEWNGFQFPTRRCTVSWASKNALLKNTLPKILKKMYYDPFLTV